MTTQPQGQPAGDGSVVVPHAAKAWDYFRSLGSPKFHVAPMVDQSELPFRMLCRKYGSTAAYTPMLHSRLFLDDPKYRQEHFTTCEGDRPLFAQFCAHDPATLVGAALLVTGRADYIDLNLGCPQRIAKRGRYGAFLMDDLPLVQSLVEAVSKEVPTPVSVKVRVFPELQTTLDYVLMLQSAGAMVLAVHGRTRDQKDLSATRADWDKIRAVKQALSIPVLANGNVRDLRDALALMDYTGCDGVLSAESLLADPALFFPSRLEPGGGHTPLEGLRLLAEYLGLVRQHPVPSRMVRGHVHKMAGAWLSEFTDVRQKINSGGLDIEGYIAATQELISLAEATGRTEPVPKLSQRALERLEKEAARQAAMEEQAREDAALAALAAQNKSAAAQTTAKPEVPPALPTHGHCADCGVAYSDGCAGAALDAVAVRADRQGGREGSECSETCHGEDAALIANGAAASLAPAAAAAASGCERKRSCECEGHPEAAGAGKRPCGGCAEHTPA